MLAGTYGSVRLTEQITTMPTYEYGCAACRNEWEAFQSISAAPIEVCPACGAKAAQRKISGGSFVLKGGGWYSDLYSSSKPSGGSGSTPSSSD